MRDRRRWRTAILVLTTPFSLAHGADQTISPKNTAAPPVKWDNRVLDTFFPDARKALVGERPKWLSTSAASNLHGKTEGGSDGKDDGQTAANGFAWSKMISADTLADEVKALSSRLADEVKTQQGFLGGENKKSRRTLSMLAAAFAIINEFDGEAKWKNQAAAARDLFARAGFNCKAATESTYREAKQRSDDLTKLLRGDAIIAPTAVDANNDWAKISERPPLMSRLELAQRDRIAPWSANASEFKKNATALEHEAEIVAALAEAVSRPGFDYSDDEKYHGYAKLLQQSAVELQIAIKNNNYETARMAAGSLSKACASCHADFR